MSNEDYKNGNELGFMKPRRQTGGQKMKWTQAKNHELLLIGFGREISPKEYEKIAQSFPEKPTPKAIQEQLSKLRAIQKKKLEDIGLIEGKTSIIRPAPEPVEGDDDWEDLSADKSSSSTASTHRKRATSTGWSVIVAVDGSSAFKEGGEALEPQKKKVRVSQSPSHKPRSTTNSAFDHSNQAAGIEQARIEGLSAQDRKFAEHDWWYEEQSDREDSGGEDGEGDGA